MPRKKKIVEAEIPVEVEIVEAETPKEVKIVKKRPSTTTHSIKNRVKVGGQWKEKGDTIKLTKEGFAFFRSKKYI
jgi:hypothetical protein